MRLFAGIPLPEQIREAIDRVIRDWKAEVSGIKYVERENLHITLKFIGEVEEQKAERIKELLGMVSFNPIEVELEGVGAFPSADRPRVVWIGVKKGFNEIAALSRQIDELLAWEGIPQEMKAFHPHVTIGRVRRYSPAIKSKMEKYAGRSFGSFTVDRFVLYKSTLTPRGPIYDRLQTYEVKE